MWARKFRPVIGKMGGHCIKNDIRPPIHMDRENRPDNEKDQIHGHFGCARTRPRKIGLCVDTSTTFGFWDL